MIPVLTPAESAALDAASPEPIEVLVQRAGRAVATAAVRLLGGTYGRRVVVVAGPGNNGADGRVAAEVLARRGVRVRVVEAVDVVVAGARLEPSDLVIDAAFGTGLRSDVEFPDVDGAPVLAVDIPSGIDGLTGAVRGTPPRAVATVTFVAPAPGLLLGAGPAHAGEVLVADIGLDPGAARIALVDDGDVAAWVPKRRVDDHKWRHAVWLIAGSRGMRGAGHLSAAAAMRGGAGYVRCSSPDGTADGPIEAVGVELSPESWADDVVEGARRFACLAIGPGLGRDADVAEGVRTVLRGVQVPVVLDGDGLSALGRDAAALLAGRSAPTVLTPHDGEFETLTGAAPGADRVGAARTLAASTGAVVLLKGPTTVVADPDGDVLLVRSGDERLATAGTGDVLTGLIAAHLALGAEPARAAAAAAHLHGRAASLGSSRSLVASDLPDLVARVWDELGADER